MFLEEYKGKYIQLELNSNAPDGWIENYFRSYNDKRYFRVKLIDCDSVGIWVNWVGTRKVPYNVIGNELNHVYDHDISHFFLIKWDFIDSVLVLEDYKADAVRIWGAQ